MITVTDLFAGAGGSALGAAAVPGVRLVMAANHSPRAIETHQLNFPDCDHDCADISQVEPRRYARTNILWASPECTNHSIARGRKRRPAPLPGLFEDPDERLDDTLAERSRSTMWDVPRFTEVHGYDVVIVENVVDAAKWVPFRAWLMAMDAYGYDHKVVSLNSMHAPAIAAPRAPQSRDRMYVVFWRKGNPAPDLDIRPAAYCATCDEVVRARQVFKPGATVGRYRQSYVYRCPNHRCRSSVVEPFVVPAGDVIDWELPAERIGDRAKPLAEKTLARIRTGLVDMLGRPHLVSAGGSWNDSPASLGEPFRTRTTRESEGLVIPLEGRDGKEPRTTADPFRTQTTRHQDALVIPYYRTGKARPATHPMPTMTTVDTAGLAFIAELRGGGSTHRPVTEPLATVCASGNHHMLVRPEELRGAELEAALAKSRFRMLGVPEIQAAMAFTKTYVVTGSKRDRVKQLGNGVTPPAAEWLVRAAVASLEGAA